MSQPATTWGTMAAERDALIDAIVSVMDWKQAMESYNNTAYKGDALKQVDEARRTLDDRMRVASLIIDKYRR